MSSFSSTKRASRRYIGYKVVHYGRSRSLNVVEIGIKRNPVCAFLLVFRCACLLSFPIYEDLLVENMRFALFTHTIFCSHRKGRSPVT